ncbi:MAG: hypothetical protein ACXQTS_02915 [Candidatus Methanospirareceae archaeon]
MTPIGVGSFHRKASSKQNPNENMPHEVLKKLTQALKSIIPDKGDKIALLLFASLEGDISYREVEELIGEEASEVVLMANEKRLMVSLSEDLAWSSGDFSLRLKDEVYTIPRVVRFAVKEALATGIWDSERAIQESFRHIGEERWGIMPQLFRRLRERAKFGKVSAKDISDVAFEFGISNVDKLIAELKDVGLISPYIKPGMREVYYEVHPLF